MSILREEILNEEIIEDTDDENPHIEMPPELTAEDEKILESIRLTEQVAPSPKEPEETQ